MFQPTARTHESKIGKFHTCNRVFHQKFSSRHEMRKFPDFLVSMERSFPLLQFYYQLSIEVCAQFHCESDVNSRQSLKGTRTRSEHASTYKLSAHLSEFSSLKWINCRTQKRIPIKFTFKTHASLPIQHYWPQLYEIRFNFDQIY